MSDYPQTPEPQDQQPIAPQMPHDNRSHRTANNPSWIVGLIVILVGAALLFNNFGTFRIDNWWALFILIPAIGSFTTAYNLYQRHQRFSSAVRGSVIGGLIITFIAVIFLFELNFGQMWPVFLIIAGLAILLNALLPD